MLLKVLAFCLLLLAYGYGEEIFTLNVPIDDNCTHLFSVYTLPKSYDYYRESLVQCLNQNATMISIHEVANLVENIDSEKVKTMTFFLRDRIINKYAIMDIIPTQNKHLDIDIKLRSPLRYVTHTACLTKQNCTEWEGMVVAMHEPLIISLGCITLLLFILVLTSCVANLKLHKERHRRNYKQSKPVPDK